MGTSASISTAKPNYFVSQRAIDDYLTNCKGIFDMYANKSNKEIYILFWEELNVYDNPDNKANMFTFAELVHRLHPQVYCPYNHKATVYNHSSESVFTCPSCSIIMPIDQRYTIHIERQPIQCESCKKTINYAMLEAQMVANRYKTELAKLFPNAPLENFPEIENSMNWFNSVKDLSNYLIQNVSKRVRHRRYGIIDRLQKLNRKWPLCKFNMDLIHGMYLQLRFIQKIGKDFPYWENKDNQRIMTLRYWRFMQLFKTHDKLIVPTVDIDIIWHAHLIEFKNYQHFCVDQLRIRPIQHEDRLGTNILDAGYTRTYMYWFEKYGEPYSSRKPDYHLFMKDGGLWSGWTRQNRWAKASQCWLNPDNQRTALPATMLQEKPATDMMDIILVLYLTQLNQFDHNDHTTNTGQGQSGCAGHDIDDTGLADNGDNDYGGGDGCGSTCGGGCGGDGGGCGGDGGGDGGGCGGDGGGCGGD
jgi:hypothetical protein